VDIAVNVVRQLVILLLLLWPSLKHTMQLNLLYFYFYLFINEVKSFLIHFKKEPS